MQTSRRGLVLAALLASAAAQAQLYPFSVSSQPYVSPVGATAITFASSQDSGHETVNLPFSFPYFGQTYTTLVVGTNGVVAFGPACTSASGSGCLPDTNNIIPSTSLNPKGVVAPFWDDLILGSGSQVRVLSSPGEVVIEWYQVYKWPTSGGTQLTFLLRLLPDGTMQIHHGSRSGTTTLSASIGYESTTGVGLSLVAKASPAGAVCTDVDQSGCCSATTTGCSAAEFIPDALYTFRTTIPNGTELAANAVVLSGLSEDGTGNLHLAFSANVQNLGTVESSTCDWRAYTSLDRTLSGDDQLVANGSLDRVDAGSTFTVLGSGATANPPDAGYYYLLFQVNPLVPQLDAGPLPDGGTTLLPDGGFPLYHQVTEGTYANNVGVSAAPFARGTDLVADSISGPTATTGAGSVETVHVVMHNAGTQGVQGVQYRVYASSDKVFDAADQVAYTGTVSLPGRAVARHPGQHDRALLAQPGGVLPAAQGRLQRPGRRVVGDQQRRVHLRDLHRRQGRPGGRRGGRDRPGDRRLGAHRALR